MSTARRPVARLAVAVAAVSVAGTLPASTVAAAPKRSPAKVSFHRWTAASDFGSGTRAGVAVVTGAVRFDRPVGRLRYDDPFGRPTRDWEYARWTSPVQPVGFGATELVASWIADTPTGTWLQVQMRATTSAGATTRWYVLGRWASGDRYVRRTSVPGQRDANGSVATDTFVAASGVTVAGYQLRVTLYRLAGTTLTPTLRSVGVMASRLPAAGTPAPASPPGLARGIELPVPRYSQNLHLGEYPQWDGGGEAWCSPTSTSMVLRYWKPASPPPAFYAWVDPDYADPWVAYAARSTYDHGYQGTGNWPFNTAYAGRFGLDGFVTRLRSLGELERFVAAGIPVITSQSFKAGELPGAGYSTTGHLMVVVGFTRGGNVIANDPAAPTNRTVRRVYPRSEFERVWQASTGGIVYVIVPEGHPLPPNVVGADPNW